MRARKAKRINQTSATKKAQALGQQVAASFMNMMKYMSDPGVQKAQERLSKAMMSMQ